MEEAIEAESEEMVERLPSEREPERADAMEDAIRDDNELEDSERRELSER